MAVARDLQAEVAMAAEASGDTSKAYLKMQQGLRSLQPAGGISGYSGANQGLSVQAEVLSCKDKGPSKHTKGATKTISYVLKLANLDSIVQHATSNNPLFRVLPNQTGLRFVKSNGSTKNDFMEHYRGILQRHAAKVAGLPSVDKLDRAKLAAIDQHVTKQRTSMSNGGIITTVDFMQPALAEWTEPEIHSSDRVTVEIQVSNQDPKPGAPPLPDPILRAGTRVQVTGLKVNMYLFDPSMSKKAKAAAAAAGTAQDAIIETTAGGEEDGPAAGEGEEAVQATGGGIKNQAEDKLDYLQDALGRHFFLNFKADKVEALQIPQNKLPPELQLPSFTNIHTQRFDPVAQPRHVLIVPLQEDASMSATVLGPEGGIFFNPNQPNRDLQGENKGTTLAGDSRTYLTGKEDRDGPGLPVRVPAYVVKPVPTADVEAAGGNVPSALADEGFTSVLASPDDAITYVLKPYEISGTVWSGQVMTAGIADHDAWADVNASVPMSAYVALSVRNLNPYNPSHVDMNVLAVGWRTKEYLYKHAFPVPLPFAKVILGNGTVAPPELKFPRYKEFGELVETIQVSNAQRGKIDLLNATEFRDDLKPYLDPAQGWEARVLVVRNSSSFASADFDQDQRDTVNGFLDRIPAIKTAEEGQKFIEDWVAQRVGECGKLEKFGYHKRGARVLVWFVKPDSAVYPAQALQTPFWTTKAGGATTTPAVKRKETEAHGEGEPPLKKAKIEEKKQGGEEDPDAMQGVESSNGHNKAEDPDAMDFNA